MLRKYEHYTTVQVEKMTKNEELALVYYVNSDFIEEVEADKKALSEILTQYGANDIIGAKIKAFEKTIKGADDARKMAAERIGGAKGIDALNDSTANTARAKAFYYTRNFRKLRGDKAKKQAEDVQAVVTAIVGRLSAIDEPDSGAEWLELATRDEYITVRNCLKSMAKALYDDKSKYKGDDVGYVIFASVKARNGEFKAYKAGTVQKAMVECINKHNIKDGNE